MLNVRDYAKLTRLKRKAPVADGPLTRVEALDRVRQCLFSEKDDHLDVGRTERMRDRRWEHWSRRANDAPFSFKLAGHATGNHLKGGPTRKPLEADPTFVAVCERAANMQFRWVEEADPNRHCLLEIHATVVLTAWYNDLINH